MNFSRISQQFRQLPPHLKLIGIGSFLLAISTLLPWYSDLDSYGIGDSFLGVTGPASFVGVALLILAAGSFIIFAAPLLDRRKPKIPFQDGSYHLFVGLQSLFLLLLVNSIYFHQKFGVNITIKESRFGMILAFFGALLLSFGAYSQTKKEANTEDLIGRLDPLMELPKSQPSASTQASERKHAPLQPLQPLQKAVPKTWGPVEISQAQLMKERMLSHMQHDAGAVKNAKAEASIHRTTEPSSAPAKKDDSAEGSYMVRMDL